MSTAECDVTEEAIARRAYELWEARGCPEGDGSRDWEAAERELRSGKQPGRSWWTKLRTSITGRDE